MAVVLAAMVALQALGQDETSWPFESCVDVFKVHSDFELDDQQRLQAVLGGLRNDIDSVLGLSRKQDPIHIVLFSTAREYTRYMQHYFPSIAQRRAIYLQDRGPGMLFTFWHDDIDTDLRHEATHAVLNQSGVQLPLWLDEGLAEYFEVEGQQRFGHNAYLRDVQRRADKGLVPSLLHLERISQMSEFNDAHYRDSWAWVHFMLHRRRETRQLLVDYLAKHRRLVPQQHLARQLEKLVADPTEEFKQHFAKVQEAPEKVAQAN